MKPIFPEKILHKSHSCYNITIRIKSKNPSFQYKPKGKLFKDAFWRIYLQQSVFADDCFMYVPVKLLYHQLRAEAEGKFSESGMQEVFRLFVSLLMEKVVFCFAASKMVYIKCQ